MEHYDNVPMYQIDLLCNYEKIIHQNLCKSIMYCIYHKEYYVREDTFYFCFFGVNETYPKKKNKNNILEYDLDIYDPFLQKRGYMETSVYLHVYWNKLYFGREMVGFSQYDMRHHEKYNNLDKDTIYVLNTNESIVSNGTWHWMLFPHLRNIEFLLNSYNTFYGKSYSISHLENMPFTLWQTNMYPVKIYEKLCLWLELLVKDIYPWSNLPPYETHFGSIGGYTERAISIFNAFEIYEGVTYKNLNIYHGEGAFEKEQYNKRSFLNNYSQDIHTKLIENITGSYDNVDFCMFRAQCYLHDICYNCERIYKNGKNGLYFQKEKDVLHIEYGFDIEAEDPRFVVCKDKVYVIFICLSPYENQYRTIGISEFDVWKPVFLQVNNMKKNFIEKNWAPFVKDDEIYFVYNYDPLTILHYDLNPEGICNVVYIQGGASLPIDTSETFLRGGSNLIPYKDGIYIGGCHSRIFKKCFEHYTHIVLLDTNRWELIYVSKPVIYYYPMYDTTEWNSWHMAPDSDSRKKMDTVREKDVNLSTTVPKATPNLGLLDDYKLVD